MKKIIFSGVLLLLAQNITAQSLLEQIIGKKVVTSSEIDAYCGRDMKVKKGRISVTEKEIKFTYRYGNCQTIIDYDKIDLKFADGSEAYRGSTSKPREHQLLIKKDDLFSIYRIEDEKRGKGSDFKNITYLYTIAAEDKIDSYDTSMEAVYQREISENYTRNHTAKFEQTDFQDESGISGMYYLSQPYMLFNRGGSDPLKIADKVYLEYDPKTYKMSVHHGEGIITRGGMREELRPGADQKKCFVWGLGSHYQTKEFYSHSDLMMLDKDLFIVGPKWTVKKRVVHSHQEGGDKVLLLGKDQKLMADLANDTTRLRSMIEKKASEYLHYFDLDDIAKHPMPKPGSMNTSLKSDALEAINYRAAGWSQDVLYAYVTSNEWYVTMEYGAPKYRRMNCVVVLYQPESDRYSWEIFTIRQDFNGSGYNSTYCDSNGQMDRAVREQDAYQYK